MIMPCLNILSMGVIQSLILDELLRLDELIGTFWHQFLMIWKHHLDYVLLYDVAETANGCRIQHHNTCVLHS